MLCLERQDFRLAVVDAGGRPHLHRTVVLQLQLGVEIAQFHHVRLGQVLRGRVSGKFIGARVAGEAGQTRLLHGDLGAVDDQLAKLAGSLASPPNGSG